MKKKLPIGIQNLREIVADGYLYVDKTEYIHRLITAGKYYFLSRPRRFGKSLLISTLKEIFAGNRELFKDLWIYDKLDFKCHPIIHIDFSNLGHRDLDLKDALARRLDAIAADMDLRLEEDIYSLKFDELIRKLEGKTKAKVVLLVDEYDKPIIDYLEDLSVAHANRETLRSFYSMIKGNDAHLHFVFLTGVSKFSQVSVFSELNNLADISFSKFYASMLGYTQEELDAYFADYKSSLQQSVKETCPDVGAEIKRWYNGYSWNARQFVYNPFSIMRLFQEEEFANYWYSTGTPTFLLKLIKSQEYRAADLETRTIYRDALDTYDIERIDLLVLLFQTGYLTIKRFDPVRRTVLLDTPNYEVESSFTRHVLEEFTDTRAGQATELLADVANALRANQINRFMDSLKTLFAGITYQQIENKESYYHSIFYLVIKLLGFDIQCEILTNRGRIDAVIETDTHVYIAEFKLGSATTALQQIRDMDYPRKYLRHGKHVVLLGIGFDTETRNIGDHVVEIC